MTLHPRNATQRDVAEPTDGGKSAVEPIVPATYLQATHSIPSDPACVLLESLVFEDPIALS